MIKPFCLHVFIILHDNHRLISMPSWKIIYSIPISTSANSGSFITCRGDNPHQKLEAS